MKTSELIGKLITLMVQHGDLEVKSLGEDDAGHESDVPIQQVYGHTTFGKPDYFFIDTE
jgi:hypothetical protein